MGDAAVDDVRFVDARRECGEAGFDFGEHAFGDDAFLDEFFDLGLGEMA